MRTIRNMTILVGLSAVLFALAATGAKAQRLSSTNFKGTFTLPLETHWGAMILPAGDYNLSYGQPFSGGSYVVAIVGEAAGSPRGMIFASARGDVSAAQNALNCVREGNTLLVRALELPAIGESIHFGLPHRAKLVAQNGKRNGYTQLAQAPTLIQRIPVKPGAK